MIGDELVSRALSEFAEEPASFMELGSDAEWSVYRDDQICVVQLETVAFVSAPRAAAGEVRELLEHVRTLVPEGKHTEWFIGPSATPTSIVSDLRALGLHDPYDGVTTVHALAITAEPPAGPEGIVVTQDVTFAEFVETSEIGWEAFGVPSELQQLQRERLPEAFANHQRNRNGPVASFVAKADGRVAAVATAVTCTRGLFLIGGATASWARGRGLYRALVRARWDYAVERGTPTLVVHANPRTSYPILRRNGFETICELTCLEGL